MVKQTMQSFSIISNTAQIHTESMLKINLLSQTVTKLLKISIITKLFNGGCPLLTNMGAPSATGVPNPLAPSTIVAGDGDTKMIMAVSC